MLIVFRKQPDIELVYRTISAKNRLELDTYGIQYRMERNVPLVGSCMVQWPQTLIEEYAKMQYLDLFVADDVLKTVDDCVIIKGDRISLDMDVPMIKTRLEMNYRL